ncbi:hypothetical protein C8F04DRAFT_1277708 [Mycena alexandri]|uniref:Uncharacterized protein n=1 Tax=Mycena alexandri TaxID=1745969 RepID=A0AAD6RZT0_9AGAR|nr:hypothetical protein C8F04DRAFT_1277708 [Mycena alexandri]
MHPPHLDAAAAPHPRPRRTALSTKSGHTRRTPPHDARTPPVDLSTPDRIPPSTSPTHLTPPCRVAAPCPHLDRTSLGTQSRSSRANVPLPPSYTPRLHSRLHGPPLPVPPERCDHALTSTRPPTATIPPSSWLPQTTKHY